MPNWNFYAAWAQSGRYQRNNDTQQYRQSAIHEVLTFNLVQQTDSATSQFYINQRSNLQLDWAPGKDGYTVFGEVTNGMNVVDFIATAPTGRAGGMGDVPKQAIIIEDIVRQKP